MVYIVSGYLAPDYCCQWFILNEVDLLHFHWAGIHKMAILITGETTWAQVGVELRSTPWLCSYIYLLFLS